MCRHWSMQTFQLDTQSTKKTSLSTKKERYFSKWHCECIKVVWESQSNGILSMAILHSRWLTESKCMFPGNLCILFPEQKGLKLSRILFESEIFILSLVVIGLHHRWIFCQKNLFFPRPAKKLWKKSPYFSLSDVENCTFLGKNCQD